MNTAKLDEILAICFSKDNKRKLTKEEQGLYIKEVRESLEADGFNDHMLHYILAQPQYLGIRGFLGWFISAPYHEQCDSIEKIIDCKEFANAPTQKKFRIVLFVLSSVMSIPKVNKPAMSQLLAWVDEFSYSNEGVRVNDFGKVFKKFFLNIYRTGADIPLITSCGFTEEYVNRIIVFFEEALNTSEAGSPEDAEKVTALRNWLVENETRIAEKNKVLVVKTEKEEEEKEALREIANDAVPGEKTSGENETQVETSENKPSNDKDSKKESSSKEKITGKTALQIMELAKNINQMENSVVELQKANKGKDKKISLLTVKLNDSTETVHSLEEENSELRSQILEQKKRLDDLEVKNKELSDRVERQVSVLDVFQEDKANSKTEQLNAVAASLVRQYKEFETAQSMDLTSDMELNLLDLIEDIFTKLEKNGVDVKGRM